MFKSFIISNGRIEFKFYCEKFVNVHNLNLQALLFKVTMKKNVNFLP